MGSSASLFVASIAVPSRELSAKVAKGGPTTELAVFEDEETMRMTMLSEKHCFYLEVTLGEHHQA